MAEAAAFGAASAMDVDAVVDGADVRSVLAPFLETKPTPDYEALRLKISQGSFIDVVISTVKSRRLVKVK